MDTFVKGGNEIGRKRNVENASGGTIIVSESAECLPHTEHVQVKRNIILIILNYRKCVNTSLERTLDY